MERSGQTVCIKPNGERERFATSQVKVVGEDEAVRLLSSGRFAWVDPLKTSVAAIYERMGWPYDFD